MHYSPFSKNQRAALLSLTSASPQSFEAPQAKIGPVGNRILPDRLSPFSPTQDIPPTVTVDSGKYGDALPDVINITANQSILAVPRPSYKRILLIVQATTPLPIYFNFGRPAGLSSPFIPANGGTLFFDNAVPQNELYLFATGNVAVPVIVMNADLFQMGQ